MDNRAYLFVHFREKPTPDGEQVYFGLSRDGFYWEPVNGGEPVLWATLGENGVRDCTILRGKDGIYRIFATDLSLAHNFAGKYRSHWPTVSQNGSKCLAMWESRDLIHWSQQRLIALGDEHFGCLWAPDVFYDPQHDDYVLHWSSWHRDLAHMAIFFSRTGDFQTFSRPQLLYQKPDAGIIDSAIYLEKGQYYLFVKSEGNPHRMIELVSDHVTGPWTRVEAFDKSMETVQAGMYEAPTAVRLDDGRWCLFIDYYGVKGAGQGYVPFIAPSMKSGDFTRSDAAFSFPYGFKHGTLLTITEEEFDRMKAHDWNDVPDKR